MASLRVEFAGLELDNPIMVSAGPLTADIEKVKRLADAGAGAAVTKTGFAKDEYYRSIEQFTQFHQHPVLVVTGFHP